ncbi:uncharacterized protein LOC106351616 isoform X6 [Brassica napus]|uniref:uncharacterized protein LOC106351616 isoform X5 n=1 Tax=Brassica napus TaxID=3708 RepID=UPI0020784E8D|nr:uncharacterized protein LOC106351616 isoform X5 [Brassica napus]XP_048634709.1 uncharacterized protein LOC106351616 isoform X6 [Brassica napus]
MRANLRSLVAKAYRVRQGRTFSSSSTTNPINYKASCITGDSVSKFDEELKAIDKDAVDFLEKRGKLPPGSLDAMYKS